MRRCLATLSFPTFVMLFAFGCDDRSSAPRGASPATPPSTTYSCKVDEDCPGLSCGPCTPGVLVTKDLVYGPQCAVNPCKDSRSTCGAQHLCVIGPKSANDPATWGTAPTNGRPPSH
jgi:hypothetical protein